MIAYASVSGVEQRKLRSWDLNAKPSPSLWKELNKKRSQLDVQGPMAFCWDLTN